MDGGHALLRILWILLYFFKECYCFVLRAINLIRLKLQTICSGKQLWSLALFSPEFLLTLWLPWLPHVSSSGFPSQKYGGFSIGVLATLFHWCDYDCHQDKATKQDTVCQSLPPSFNSPYKIHLLCSHFPDPWSVWFVFLFFPESIVIMYRSTGSLILQGCSSIEVI